MFDGPWGALLVLFAAAVAVLTVSRRMASGRKREGSGRKQPKFDLDTARLESLPVSRIADAEAGSIHLEGVLESSTQSFGQGRPCVWLNRAGQSSDTAIAAELVILADDTGQVGLENLERARVIAPREPGTAGHDSVALYLGDRVQVLGQFRPERYDPSSEDERRVYGLLGSDAPMQIRVLTRAEAPSQTPGDAAASGDDDDHDPA
ncbi:MAG: hypothetical protein B7733_07775 [Myxococcales bacterium FL481]|nr:MAG: hypothetical protein B7733_07775 [Myxococcales bacterium FL481]